MYASWSTAPLHHHARSILAQYRSSGVTLTISRQVIREWLATLNRPRTGLALADLISEAQSFASHFTVFDDTALTTAQLLELLPAASGMRVHDVNIVATMRCAGVHQLLTNNPDDFRAFGNIIAILPLV